MKRYILIYNPQAGDAGFKHRLDEVIHYLKLQRCVVLPMRTAAKEDMREIVLLGRQLAAAGIIVAGGDGTLHETVNAMLATGFDVPVGIIPSGTSNDFAQGLNIGYDLERCCRIIAGGKWRNTDVGKVNDLYFLNVASAGLFTSVAHNVETPLKNTVGKLAYYLKGLGQLPHFNTYRMKITADGQVIEDEVLFFLVMNSGMVGSFPKLAPQARIDDGKLDLLIVNKCRIPELMGLFVSIMAGNHIQHRNVAYLQAQQIHIECDSRIESDLDGERGPLLPLSISTIAGRIKVFCE
ncbi:MAG: YegS/Rv2252/BmrU family lipid kinase [Negativicutes bacterium]|nr:YegS/Rv2252/BmrU family lipid kinase [Negativicutes bacterium]